MNNIKSMFFIWKSQPFAEIDKKQLWVSRIKFLQNCTDHLHHEPQSF